MPDVDTPRSEQTPSPAEIDAWPSGRSADEQPAMTPNPSTGGDADDPEDGAVETPPSGGGAGA